MRRASIIITLLASVLGVSCFHKVTTDTQLLIKTYVQSESGGMNNPTVETVAYAFYLDDDDLEAWKPESYDDALNGIITNSVTHEKRTVPDVTGQPFIVADSASTYISLEIEDSPILAVVVDVTDGMYAYAPKVMEAVNLPETYVTLIFHTWKSARYTEGNTKFSWTVVPNIPQP